MQIEDFQTQVGQFDQWMMKKVEYWKNRRSYRQRFPKANSVRKKFRFSLVLYVYRAGS